MKMQDSKGSLFIKPTVTRQPCVPKHSNRTYGDSSIIQEMKDKSKGASSML